jgi:hypothetical protein
LLVCHSPGGVATHTPPQTRSSSDFRLRNLDKPRQRTACYCGWDAIGLAVHDISMMVQVLLTAIEAMHGNEATPRAFEMP